jgi:hypothetical protein
MPNVPNDVAARIELELMDRWAAKAQGELDIRLRSVYTALSYNAAQRAALLGVLPILVRDQAARLDAAMQAPPVVFAPAEYMVHLDPSTWAEYVVTRGRDGAIFRVPVADVVPENESRTFAALAAPGYLAEALSVAKTRGA